MALNKIDLLPKKEALLPLLSRAAQWGDWKALVPISAQNGDGVEELLGELTEVLPEGPPLFDPEVITDLPLRFLAAELIREKVFRLTGQEVPYSTAVTVDQYLEPEEADRPVAITATIHVEREGHKGIIIGKGGAMIKRSAPRPAWTWKSWWAGRCFWICWSGWSPSGRARSRASRRWATSPLAARTIFPRRRSSSGAVFLTS